MSQLLIVFARYPEVGRCKTRLISQCGAQAAAELHTAMTRFTIAWASKLAYHAGTSLQVRFTGGDRESMQSIFGSQPEYVPQCGGDLGARMRESVERAAEQGIEKVVIVGTDCPQLGCEFTLEAFAALDQHDVCLAPATDGGYTLLGVRTRAVEETRMLEALFENIRWGSSDVLATTLNALEQTSAKVRLLRTLSDVDYPDDLPVWEQALSGHRPPKPKFSIVVPVAGHEEWLSKALSSAGESDSAELIIVAAKSSSQVLQTAAKHNAQHIQGTAMRSKQMNLGAAAASGEILLFLHADTLLPQDFGESVAQCFEGTESVGGAFLLGIDSNRLLARCVEWGVKIRSTTGQLPYGDQALFVPRTTFQEMGGFKEQPIMEDYEFVKRLRARGRICICSSSVSTSPRRWHRVGFLRTTLLNQMIIVAYHLGVSPKRLARIYRGKDKDQP